MRENNKMGNFAELVSKKQSNFLAKLEFYQTNRKQLDRSAKIAINILAILKERDWSQKDLAEKLHVSEQQISKLIKGKTNLTFNTVGKIEEALGVTLMEIPDYKTANEIIVKVDTPREQTTWTVEIVAQKTSIIQAEMDIEKTTKLSMKTNYNVYQEDSCRTYLKVI